MTRFFQRRFSIYFCICAFICTAAFAIQPTVRAGSINLSNNVKPVTPTIAQTGSGDTDTSINRGAALFKFQKTTVPAATPTNTNPTNSGGGTSGSSASSNTLAELQKQIDDLKSAQLTLEQTQTDLEHNAITTDIIADTVAEQVRTLDLTATNLDLKNALTDIKATNTDLQTSLNSIQQQAESLNTNIDSRLQYRGLLDSSNNVAFVTKNDITPEKLATKIATNSAATATLSEKITPKSSDIQRIIKEDLIEREILDNTGKLNVEKKGEVQVTEATVTDALNNSTAFKNLVSAAAIEKGFLTNESNTIKNLATKDTVTPEAIATKIASSATAQQTLSGKLGPNEDAVRNLIVHDLKTRGIVSNDNDETLQLLKTSDLDTKLNEKNVITTANMNSKLTGFAKTTDITPEIIATQIANSNAAKQTLSGKLGPNEDAVKNLIVHDLKTRGIVSNDNDETLQLLKTSDLDTKLNEKNVITTANMNSKLTGFAKTNDLNTLANKAITTDNKETALAEYAKSTDIAPETLANQIAENTTATALLSAKIRPNETEIQNIIKEDLIEREILDNTGKLNVEKKGEVQVTEATVTDALNNSTAFKNLVSAAAIEKGFITDTALNNKNFVTTTALNNKNFLTTSGLATELNRANVVTTDSDDFKNLATKSSVTSLSNSIDMLNADESNTNSIAYKIKSLSDTLNGDENTVGSIANKVKTAGFAKTNDVVTKTGFADQLEADLNKNDSTIKTALGNTFASKGTVESLSGTVNTLTGNESTEGSIAYKLKDFAKTNDVVTKTGFADQLEADLNKNDSTIKTALGNTFASKGTVESLSGTVNTLTGNESTEGSIAYKLKDFAKTNDVVTKTGFAEQLQNDLNAENSSVKSALSTAGFAKTADVVTNTDFKNKLKTDLESNDVKTVLKTAGFAESTEITTMRDNLLNGDENTVGSIANKLKAAKVITETNFADKLPETVITTDNMSNKLSGDFATKSSVTSLTNAVNALNDDESNTNSVAYKIKTLSDTLNAGENTEGSIANKLKAAKVVSTDTMNETLLNFASKDSVTNLSNTMNALNGNIDNPDSILYKIKNNQTIRNELKGDAGTGINYRGEIASYSELESKTKQQGDAYYNNADGLLYICSGDGTTCSWPENTKGVRFKGERGNDAKSVDQAYCDENLNLIKIIYGSNKDCNNFTYDNYNEMTGGTRAYCLSLAQKATAITLKTDSGIGAKLEKIFGTGIVANLIQNKVNTTVDNKNFVLMCEDKYDEIMSGEDGKDGQDGSDGKDAKSAEQTYCETNFATVSALYSGIATESDCANFTAEQYKAMMEGAKAYCLLIAQDFTAGKLSADTGIGKRLNEKLKISGTSDGIFKLTESKKPVSLSEVLKTTKFNNNETFLDACEAKYNEIMSGDDGKDGQDGSDGKDAKSAEQTYCETNFATVSALYSGIATESDCANFTAEQYKAMMEGSKAYCLLVAQDFSSGKLNVDSGIGKRLEEELKVDGGNGAGIFSLQPKSGNTVSLSTVLKNTTFNGNKSFLVACAEKYNEIMSGKDGEKGEKGADGEDAVKTWCRAHTLDGAKSGGTVAKTLSAAKLVAAFKASGNTDTQIEKSQDNTTGEVTGYFKTLEACIAAVNEDPTIMSGESAAETQYNEDVKKEKKEGNTNFTLGSNTVTTFETKKNTFGSKMVTADNIGTKLIENKVVTDDNFKNKLKTDLDTNDVKSVLKTAGFAESTEITTMRDNLLNGDENTVGSIANKVKTAGFAKTNDVVTKTGFAEQLQNDLNAENSSVKSALATAGFAKTADVVTNTDFKNKLKTDLESNDVKTVLKTAGFAESTEITTMRDNLLNGDENTVGSIANKVKTAGFAKTNDVVTKTGFADQLEADLNKNDSTIKTALGNTFASKGTVESLSGTVNTLTGNESTEGSIAYKLKDFAKTNDVVTKTGFADQLEADLNKNDSTIKTALGNTFASKGTVESLSGTVNTLTGNESTEGSIAYKLKDFAKTNDVVTKTGFAEQLQNDLNAENSTVKSALSTAGFAKTADVVTNTDFKNKLKTNLADSEVKSTLETAGFAKTNDVVTKTGFAEQLQNDLNAENSSVKSALATAGFAKTADVVTNTDFKNKLKTNLADSEVKSTLETAGFAKSDAVTALATRTNTLETKAITTDNLNTKMTNAGFAKSADVVSTSNFATQLQNSLTNNNVKSALADAGFAKSDVTDTVVTMSDLSKLLSGGLIVDSDGSVKLNSKSSKATSIENKIIEAKAKTNDNNIQTTGLKATTSITASIANVAASAAAASNEEINESKCNEMEYMFWDSYFEGGKGKCEKCPEGTYFNPESIKQQNLPRCICEDKALTFGYADDEWKCVPSGDTDCQNKENTYWNGNACNECPPETYFNPESMKNSNLPRCICEDKTATFNTSSGQCTPAGASACAGMGMIWSSAENKCIDCPDSAPFDNQTHTCVCKETEMIFSSQKMACIKCDAGQIEQYGECVEADENMCAQDSRYFWHIDENRCMSCPDYAPYDAILGRCTCKDEGWAFTPKTASCEECPGDTEYNSSTKTCTCKEPGQTFNLNDWTCQ